MMRNGKIREYLQDCHDKRTDGDATKGISAPGSTRWGSGNEQLKQQINTSRFSSSNSNRYRCLPINKIPKIYGT